jgi:hypothetical protein
VQADKHPPAGQRTDLEKRTSIQRSRIRSHRDVIWASVGSTTQISLSDQKSICHPPNDPFTLESESRMERGGAYHALVILSLQIVPNLT